jgi:ankyrin repeat protein
MGCCESLNLLDECGDIHKNNIQNVKKLLNAGCDINIRDPVIYQTPLILSCITNKNEILKILLINGANPNLQDKNGMTALIIACLKNNYDAVKLLLKYNININHQDKNGMTALMIACLNKNEAIVKLLLDNCANIWLKCNSGDTVWSICIRCTNNNIIKLLEIKYNYHINIQQQYNIDNKKNTQNKLKSDLVEININEDEDKCIICITNKKSYACLPCGHMIFCKECTDEFNKTQNKNCPECRCKINEIKRIYM